ncbi:MAG: peroxiredoxin [Nitratireductor sp.]|nr:peroxiredoxin [Nitratireductor sp.]
MIQPGDRLPEVKFNVMSDDGAIQLSTSDIFAGKKVVLFGVPGAFTPTCHGNHLPGFVDNLPALRDKGVDEVAVVAVNDMHVMKAWAEASGAKGRIRFLADGAADFARATGLAVDLSEVGMGIRVQRFSMIVEDGVVTALNTGDKPGQADVAGAARILDQL